MTNKIFTRHRHYMSLWILLGLLSTFVLSLEEAQPEIFLSPRSLNPHPSVASYIAREFVDTNKVGPVMFPGTTSSPDSSDNSNVLTIERSFNHPVDYHPYPRVANKNKYLGIYSNKAHDSNPRVYENELNALSNHGLKVLSKPASVLRKDYTFSSLSAADVENVNQRKDYAFSYKVVDHLTGDDFSHTQSQNSRATNGEYRVKLPDGRVQIVSYIADKNGYKADVKYTEDDPPSPNLQIQGISDSPRSQIRPIPILKQNTYDYQYDLPTEYDGKSLLYSPQPTQRNKVYEDYNIFITPTPQSHIQQKAATFYGDDNSQPNVEIYTNHGINRIAGLGTFILSTAAPVRLENDKEYKNVVVSTQTPAFENFSPVYINTPKFKVVQNQQDSSLVYGK